MANENKMQYVILGLLSHESLTGYEMKKRMDKSMNLFWSGSYGSIYPTLQRLKTQGMVKNGELEEKEGRSKIIYEITEEGTTFLKEWLSRPVIYDEIRYEILLKMFFGNVIGSEEILKHVQEFENRTSDALPQLERTIELLSGLKEDTTHEYYMLTALFGVKLYKASLEWCDEVKTYLKKDEGVYR